MSGAIGTYRTIHEAAPLIPRCARDELRRRSRKRFTFSCSLAVGASISTYTLIDGRAARIADPFAYTATVFVFGALMMLALHGRRANLRDVRTNAFPIIVIGVLMLVAYGLVVGAFKLSGVAYAAAVREVSIPLAAIAGRVFLGEPFGKARIAGSIVVACGIALIALAK